MKHRKITPELFKELLKNIQPELTIVSPYTRMADFVQVKDKIGILYRSRAQDLLKGKVPMIQSAVDKNKAFEIKSRIIHGDKYSYNKVQYKNAKTVIILTCKEHGDFSSTYETHLLQGHGCWECGKKSCVIKNRKNSSGFWGLDMWIENSKKSPRFDSYKLYVILCSDENEQFLKIGRTFVSLKKRFDSYAKLPYKRETLFIYENKNPKMIYDLEDKVKNSFKDYLIEPKKHFNGTSECYQYNNEIIEYLKLQTLLK